MTIDPLKWAIHNLLHRVPWLWELHKVRHSVERVGCLGSVRFHFGEALVYDGLLYVPLALLGFRGEVLLAPAVVGAAIGHCNPASLRRRIGPLGQALSPFRRWRRHDPRSVGEDGPQRASRQPPKEPRP